MRRRDNYFVRTAACLAALALAVSGCAGTEGRGKLCCGGGSDGKPGCRGSDGKLGGGGNGGKPEYRGNGEQFRPKRMAQKAEPRRSQPREDISTRSGL